MRVFASSWSPGQRETREWRVSRSSPTNADAVGGWLTELRLFEKGYLLEALEDSLQLVQLRPLLEALERFHVRLHLDQNPTIVRTR